MLVTVLEEGKLREKRERAKRQKAELDSEVMEDLDSSFRELRCDGSPAVEETTSEKQRSVCKEREVARTGGKWCSQLRRATCKQADSFSAFSFSSDLVSNLLQHAIISCTPSNYLCFALISTSTVCQEGTVNRLSVVLSSRRRESSFLCFPLPQVFSIPQSSHPFPTQTFFITADPLLSFLAASPRSVRRLLVPPFFLLAFSFLTSLRLAPPQAQVYPLPAGISTEFQRLPRDARSVHRVRAILPSFRPPSLSLSKR